MNTILKYPLYRRITPSNKLDALGFLPAGSVVEFSERILGDKLDGIDTWIKGVDGFHYWEGGFERTTPLLNPANSLSSFFEEYRLEEFWKRGFDGRNVKVGIIDSYFDEQHPTLKKIRKLNCINLGEKSNKHHGPYMASIIGGADFESGLIGVAPEADFKFVGIGSEGKISVERFQEALKILGDVDIISMSMTNSSSSFGSNVSKEKFAAIIKEKPSLQLFLAAAGNEGDWNGYAKKLYPANFEGVYPVAGFSTADSPIIVKSNFNSHKNVKHFVHHYSGFFDKILPEDFRNTFNASPNGSSSATAFLCGIFTLLLCAQKQNRISGSDILSTFFKRVKVSNSLGSINSNAMKLNKEYFFSLLK